MWMRWAPSGIIRLTTLVVAMFLGAGLIVGCSKVSDQSPDSENMVDSGSWYSREQWPHDGNQVETEHFVVYSDAASPEARHTVAEIGEELLTELVAQFGIVEDEMFRYPPGQDKIHIYAFKNRYPQAWGARAYYGGLIIWSLDHQKRDTDLDNYVSVAKHELVHVVESLLKGRDVAKVAVAIRVNMWFSEGFAEAVAGGTSGGVIRDQAYLDRLTATYGPLSPIAFRTDGQVMDLYSEEELGSAYMEYHYPMYQLAVEYLMDADGLGKSPQDVARIFTDLAEGTNFSTAFENRMGISLTDYEEQFFDLMDGYLPEGEGGTTKPLMPIGVGLVVVMVCSLTAWRLLIRRRDSVA